MFHGTRQILGQLVFTVQAQQALRFKYKDLHNENLTTMTFIDKYCSHQEEPSAICFPGKHNKEAIPLFAYQVIRNYTGKDLPNVFTTTQRLKKEGVLYCNETKQDYTRNSDFCKFKDETPPYKVGSIQFFVVNPPFVILKQFSTEPFSPAIRSPRRTSIKDHVLLTPLIACKIQQEEMMRALPIENIMMKCIVCANVIFTLPNTYEHH